MPLPPSRAYFPEPTDEAIGHAAAGLQDRELRFGFSQILVGRVEPLPGGRPHRAQDRQDRGEWSQHHDEMNQQGVGRKTIDHRHCANATSLRADKLGEP